MSKSDVLSTILNMRCQKVMYCLRFGIPGHESISEAAIRILRNALMTATGGQIAFMRASTKIIVLMRASAKIRGESGASGSPGVRICRTVDKCRHRNHVWPAGHWCRQPSRNLNHVWPAGHWAESRVASRTLARANHRHSPALPVDTLCGLF